MLSNAPGRPRFRPRPRSVYNSEFAYYAIEYNISREGVMKTSEPVLKAYCKWYDEESRRTKRRACHLSLGEWKVVYSHIVDKLEPPFLSQEELDDLMDISTEKPFEKYLSKKEKK